MTPTDLVNLDTGAAIAFTAEGSPTRMPLKALVQGKTMVMCETARREFANAVSLHGGPLEQARAGRLLGRVTLVPNNPSPRVLALKVTHALPMPDRMIFGTGDSLGAVTATTDAKAIRSAAARGVQLVTVLFPPARFTGR